MSALSLKLSQHPVTVVRDVPRIDTDLPLVDSPTQSFASLPSLPTQPLLSPPISSLSLSLPSLPRPNEHLAVILPRNLWKPDSMASMCDNLFCRKLFSIFERRHHCRKCGDVFCHSCSSKTTKLLDTSHLPFFHPPRNTPIIEFASPASPVVESRVCDDCYDQIHIRVSTPRTPELFTESSPIAMLRSLSLDDSGNSSPSSMPSTPPNTLSLVTPLQRKRNSLRSKSSHSSLRSSSSSNGSASICNLQQRPRYGSGNLRPHGSIPEDTDCERSYGELDAYPLRRASSVCKASGGGRWEPHQPPVLVGYRVPVPGGKAPYERMLEQEAAEEEMKKSNPIIRHGEIQYRFPRDPDPINLPRSYSLSTF